MVSSLRSKVLIAMFFVFATVGFMVPHASAAEFDTVIDVRTAEEFREGHADGAMNVDILSSSFAAEVKKLDVTKSYAVYCRSGARSARAKEQMEKMGFKNVKNLGSLSDAIPALKKKEGKK